MGEMARRLYLDRVEKLYHHLKRECIKVVLIPPYLLPNNNLTIGRDCCPHVIESYLSTTFLHYYFYYEW